MRIYIPLSFMLANCFDFLCGTIFSSIFRPFFCEIKYTHSPALVCKLFSRNILLIVCLCMNFLYVDYLLRYITIIVFNGFKPFTSNTISFSGNQIQKTSDASNHLHGRQYQDFIGRFCNHCQGTL